MHPGGIDGVNRMNAVHDGWDDRPGDLVDDRAEAGVFLRRPADDGERPDRILAVIYLVNIQHRKRMSETVVSQVVAEWSFGKLQLGMACSRDEETPIVG